MRAQVARKRAVTMPLTPRTRARRRRRPGKPAQPERRLAQEKGSMRTPRSRKRRQPARPMPNRQRRPERQPELVRQQPRLVAKANMVAARAAQPKGLLPKRERAWHHQRVCLHKLAAAKVSTVKVRPRKLALPLQPLRARQYRQARQHRQRQARVPRRAHQLRQARREQLQLRLAPLQLAAQR